MNLDEHAVLLDQATGLPAGLLVGRDRGNDDDRAGADEPRCDPADALDVRVAVSFRVAETLGQVLADDVTVESLDEQAALLQIGGGVPGDRGFPGGGKPGQPDDKRGAHDSDSTTCNPHSVLSSPIQRPSRPDPGSVQCVQPIDA